MKLSELKKQIEDTIVEILSEEDNSDPNKLKKDLAAAQTDQKAAAEQNKQAPSPAKKAKQEAANSNVETIKKKITAAELSAKEKPVGQQTENLFETEDEDEFSTPDDKTSDKNATKGAKEEEKKNKEKRKKLDSIIKAYKEIEGEIKEKAKAANNGDKEAKAWINKYQPIIKAYNKAKKIN